jgi:hypothetical protein
VLIPRQRLRLISITLITHTLIITTSSSSHAVQQGLLGCTQHSTAQHSKAQQDRITSHHITAAQQVQLWFQKASPLIIIGTSSSHAMQQGLLSC